MTVPVEAMTTYGPVTACQVSGTTPLQPVLWLGYLPPVNVMRPIGTPHDQELWFPAELLYCPTCHLVQLGYTADPTCIFPPTYPYTSGTTRILRENFADLYREICACVGLQSNDFVVDIGSNDGTLLANFQHGGCRVLGIEPTMAGALAEERGIPTVRSFFTPAVSDHVLREHGSARLVTAANVFAHIPHIHDIVEAVGHLLGPDGVFVSESHYLLDLITTLQYDTIYHEHLRHYSLHSLRFLLEAHGFRIFRVRRIPTHGGSIRVYAGRSDRYPVERSVERLLAEERTAGLTSQAWIPAFRRRVTHSKLALYELLKDITHKTGVIYGIGAPSRASTLINYVGLDEGFLECVVEIKGSKKIGYYIPGTKIPVVEESRLYQEQPPYALVLSWHIADELCQNLKRRGFRGDFIVPLPEPRIIRSASVQGA